MLEGKILEKLGEHDKRFDEHSQRFGKIEQKLDEHGVMLQDHQEKLDFIIEYLKNEVATKAELQELKEAMLTRGEYLKGQDQVMTILKDMQQERAFTYGWLRRHDKDIELIKYKLAI